MLDEERITEDKHSMDIPAKQPPKAFSWMIGSLIILNIYYTCAN